MADTTREDRAKAIECLFDPGGDLLDAGTAKERIVAAIAAARAEGAAAALADPEKVLESAEKLLRPNGSAGVRVTGLWWSDIGVCAEVEPGLDDIDAEDLRGLYEVLKEARRG